eukprot:321807-Amphidinium_carterae.3
MVDATFHSCAPSTSSTTPADGDHSTHSTLALESADGSHALNHDDYTHGELQTDAAVPRILWLLSTAQDVGPQAESHKQVNEKAKELFTINLYRGHLPVAGRNYMPYLNSRHQIGRRCTALREVIDGFRYSTIFPSVGLPIHFHPQDLAIPQSKPRHYCPTVDTEGVYLDASVGTTTSIDSPNDSAIVPYHMHRSDRLPFVNERAVQTNHVGRELSSADATPPHPPNTRPSPADGDSLLSTSPQSTIAALPEEPPMSRIHIQDSTQEVSRMDFDARLILLPCDQSRADVLDPYGRRWPLIAQPHVLQQYRDSPMGTHFVTFFFCS